MTNLLYDMLLYFMAGYGTSRLIVDIIEHFAPIRR